jgi:hypothetical protein
MAESLDGYATSIEPFLAARSMPTHARLALESGLEGLRGRAVWARRALREVKTKRRPRRRK